MKLHAFFFINLLQLFHFKTSTIPNNIFPNLFHLNQTLLMKMIMTSCRRLGALFAFVLIAILFLSSVSLCQEEQITVQRQRILSIRRLLMFPTMASVSTTRSSAAGTAMKEPKKAVESSLRKAPASVPNPTQNK